MTTLKSIQEIHGPHGPGIGYDVLAPLVIEL